MIVCAMFWMNIYKVAVPYRFLIGSRHGKIDIPINTQEVKRQQPTYFTACLLLVYINYYFAMQYCRSLFDNLSIVVDVWFIGQRIFLSFHCFFPGFSFLFFNVSDVDTRVVGLFAVSPGVNELSTRMSVTRSNDSAQAGMTKKNDLLTGYIYLRVNRYTFCDDNGYSW